MRWIEKNVFRLIPKVGKRFYDAYDALPKWYWYFLYDALNGIAIETFRTNVDTKSKAQVLVVAANVFNSHIFKW